MIQEPYEISGRGPVYKIPCAVCGMVANLDPWFHQQRYRHRPVIVENGQRLIHNGRGAFVPMRAGR